MRLTGRERAASAGAPGRAEHPGNVCLPAEEEEEEEQEAEEEAEQHGWARAYLPTPI